MNTLRIISDKSRYIVAALLVAFSVFVPMLASAAQVTERSIELSSASEQATNVTYKVDFSIPSTSAGAAAFVVEFCTNSPLIGEACDAPAGMAAASATSPTSGVTMGTNAANKVVAIKAIAASENVSVEFAGITNPTNADTIYARILTYATSAAANAYSAESIGTPVDSGSVAFSITDAISVSGDVLESLTFCVSKVEPTYDCGGTTAPTLQLGEDVGDGVIALEAGAVSQGSLFTQISTNAVNGAVVRLKSNAATCGGLVRAGAATNAEGCGILPALNTDVTAGSAKFGVKTTTAEAASGATNPNGTLQPIAYYNNSTFALRAANDNLSGVTSTYGDSFLDTDDAPVNNQNMELLFGATIANDTPAGRYSADLSLIATGKF